MSARLQQEVVRLRDDLQTCQSRLRLAQHAIDAFRQRLMPLAMTWPISDSVELLSQLSRIENLLAGGEVQP